MERLFSFIKEVVQEFSTAYKYAELDFYKLKSDVISLINNAKEKGYGNPDYCSMKIDIISNIETNVVIDAYYKKGNNGKYQKFTKTLDIGMLTNIPCQVKNRLDKFRNVEVKLDDFMGLYSVKENDIIPSVLFNHLYTFKLSNVKEVPIRKELHIKDNLFYYEVVLVYVFANGDKKMKVKHFGNIINMPEEVENKISSTEDRACFIVCK